MTAFGGSKVAKGDEGIVLLAIGIVIGIAGAVAAYTCTASLFGYCFQYAYRDIGLLVAGVGGILLVVGLVMIATKAGPSAGFAPPLPAPAYGPAPIATCPVCGQPLAWIAANNRWYCSRCGQYR